MASRVASGIRTAVVGCGLIGAVAARLAEMPSLVLRLSVGRDPYLLPPIRYPDGKTYLRIGGDPVDKVVEKRGAS